MHPLLRQFGFDDIERGIIMKRIGSIVLLLALALGLGFAFFADPVHADEVKVIAVIVKIKLAEDGASAVVTLKENESGELIDVLVTDDLTLDKFKDHRIVDGDEIRLKYEVEGERKLSRYFRKTAGC